MSNRDIRENKPNIGFGVLCYTGYYYLGVSVPQLSIRDLGNALVQTNDYFSNHYNFSGAHLFGQDEEEVSVKPAVLATYTRGVPFIMDLSTTVYLKNKLGIGANYRTNNEMSGILSVNADLLKLGYIIISSVQHPITWVGDSIGPRMR